MLKRVRRVTPHAAILICNMYIVFYLIDRVNRAMNFIDNGLTKGLLVVLCALTLVNVRALTKSRPGRAKSRSGSEANRRAPRGGEARR